MGGAADVPNLRIAEVVHAHQLLHAVLLTLSSHCFRQFELQFDGNGLGRLHVGEFGIARLHAVDDGGEFGFGTVHEGGIQLRTRIRLALGIKQLHGALIIVGQIKNDLVQLMTVVAVKRGLQRVAKGIVAAELEQGAIGIVMALHAYRCAILVANMARRLTCGS